MLVSQVCAKEKSLYRVGGAESFYRSLDLRDRVQRQSGDRELLELTEPILRSDKTFPQSRTSADEISRLLRLTDEQIADVMAAEKPAGALSLKKISVPFLTSQLSSLDFFHRSLISEWKWNEDYITEAIGYRIRHR